MIKFDIRWEKNPKKIIENFERKFPGELDTIVKDTTAEYAKKIMEVTEVKTGQARRNWFVRKLSNAVWEIYNKISYVEYIPYKKAIGIIKRRRGRAQKMLDTFIPKIKETMTTKLSARIRGLWQESGRAARG